MQLGQILKLEDAIKLATLLSENGYSNIGLTIMINLGSDELLNKVNEEIYYHNNKDKSTQDIEHVDEIVLNINNITFKYVVENEERSIQ